MRDKKVEVLKSIPPLDPEHLVRGQSRGYREEPGVAPDSQVAQKPGRLHSLRPLRGPQRARALRPLGAQAPMQAAIEPGMSFPLGDAGVSFSVFSKHARAVQVLLFDQIDAPRASCTLDLEAQAVLGAAFILEPHSLAVLVARARPETNADEGRPQ